MERPSVQSCELTQCPLAASIAVAETVIEGYDSEAFNEEPAHAIGKQTRLARTVFEQMRSTLGCEGHILNRENQPTCPIDITAPMSLLSKNGETAHMDGYYSPKKPHGMSGQPHNGNQIADTGQYL